MKIAIVPLEMMNELPWIFEIPVGGWMIQRMEEDGSVGQYAGLKGEDFNQEQLTAIQLCNGQCFDSVEAFSQWLTQYGEIQQDL